MKGLLIKDIRLMKVQRSFFILIYAVGVGLALFTEDSTYAVGFPTFVISLFTVSTISYDEFDNGNAFLFSLPITRKGYVAEKYCLGILLGGSAWLLSSAVVLIAGTARGIGSAADICLAAASVLPLMLLLLAVMLPVQLKFGAEKGRVALLIALACIILIGSAGIKTAEMLHIDIFALLDGMPVPGLGAVLAAALLTALLLLAVSAGISTAVMKRKQF